MPSALPGIADQRSRAGVVCALPRVGIPSWAVLLERLNCFKSNHSKFEIRSPTSHSFQDCEERRAAIDPPREVPAHTDVKWQAHSAWDPRLSLASAHALFDRRKI